MVKSQPNNMTLEQALARIAELEANPTLRDQFAMSALCSLPLRSWGHLKLNDDDLMREWANSSYAVADYMLEARKTVTSKSKPMTSADLIAKAIAEYLRVLAQEKANGAYEQIAELHAKAKAFDVIIELNGFVKD